MMGFQCCKRQPLSSSPFVFLSIIGCQRMWEYGLLVPFGKIRTRTSLSSFPLTVHSLRLFYKQGRIDLLNEWLCSPWGPLDGLCYSSVSCLGSILLLSESCLENPALDSRCLVCAEHHRNRYGLLVISPCYKTCIILVYMQEKQGVRNYKNLPRYLISPCM